MRMNSAGRFLSVAIGFAAFGCQFAPSDAESKVGKGKSAAANDSDGQTKDTAVQTKDAEVEAGLALQGFWFGVGKVAYKSSKYNSSQMVIRLLDGDSMPIVNGQMSVAR